MEKYKNLLSKFKKVFPYLMLKVFDKRKIDQENLIKTGTAKRVNTILRHIGGSSYLEIGVNYGYTFEGVEAKVKVGVDPKKRIINTKNASFIKSISDNFFANNTDSFDLIFIDGLHDYRQVLRDVINSLNVLNSGGALLVDDIYPSNFEFAAKPWQNLTEKEKQNISQGKYSWSGDVYKAIFLLVDIFQNDLEFATLSEGRHYQMVIWPKIYKSQFLIPPETVISKFDSEEYLSVLSHGIPLNWNVIKLEDLEKVI